MRRRGALLLAIMLGVCTVIGTWTGEVSFAAAVEGTETVEASGEIPETDAATTGEDGTEAPEESAPVSDPGESSPADSSGDLETSGAPGEGSGDSGTTAPDRESTPEGSGTDADVSNPAPETESPFPAGEDTPEDLEIGHLEVSIAATLILEREVTFRVSLRDSEGTVREKEITPGGDGARSRVSFTGLPEGMYQLTVIGPGFASYTQEIPVTRRGCRVQLTTGFLAGYSYVAGGLHPGVIRIGDVDGDGDVDDNDKNILVDAVDRQQDANQNGYVTDLNGDGRVDLVDLSYLAKSYGEIGDTAAALEDYVSPAVIQGSVPEGTVLAEGSGSLEGLLLGEENVILKPASGERISSEYPVSLSFEFNEDGEKETLIGGILIETGGSDSIASAVVEVTYEEDGTEHTISLPVSDVEYLLKEGEVITARDAQGNIRINLGTQVVVKRVTLTISAMRENPSLAEISRVEFVGDMEARIPEPEMNIPQNLTATAGSERFDLTWDPEVNITGYEVLIQQEDKEETILTAAPFLSVTSFAGGDVKNYTTYTVRVQSVNGTWRSGYGDPVDVTPKPAGPPDKPDNVSAVGKYQSIAVSWKDMDDTLTYNVYYKVKDSEEAYIKIEGVELNTYTIMGLEDLTEYELYVTGVNELGESPESIHCAAKTTDLNPAEMIKYNLINRDENGVPGSAHLLSALRNGGEMVNSDSDTESGTAWGTVDNNAASYYSKTTWDDGGFNPLGSNGVIYEFDQAYQLDTIALLPTDGMQYSYAQVRWWDEDGNDTVVKASILQKQDSEGRGYYMLKLPAPVTAKKIQIGLARYLATSAYQLITISEVYFYHYDTLRDEIMALYTDDLHMVLREDVTQETIDVLRAKVEAPDEFGEENPNKEALLRELDTAEMILNDEALNTPVEIHTGITTNDVNRGFGGLNAWQPLGIAAGAGETVTVYVGHNTKSTGDTTNLQLVATQYHAESGALSKVVATLKVGANEITVPKIGTSTGMEAGGALYVQYTGSSADDRYAVRVSGGAEVPILDLYRITDETERRARAEAYVTALDDYTARMESLHQESHGSSENANLKYDYDAKNCILGASDILLDTMMLSLPVAQIKAGLGSGTAAERAEKLLASMDAMEGMMGLFYQHKGLNANAAAAVDQIPKGHLNIRYQRMFSGAFMYAAGNHIGIEWNECAGMVTASPVISDEEGRYVSGRYFGWGIAHEIGHCINQGQYAVAEITNNYFSVLAQARDTNESVRFSYENVFRKVTSGTVGNASNVFTQLGMYWQLHLAYDSGYNYMTYEDPEKQLENLFFARVDTYARTPSAAPAPGGVALTLGSSTDQTLMRLACAAAEKDILDFFVRWGKVPDEATLAYAGQFPKEERAIYYANDDSRVYAKNGSGSQLAEDGSTEAVGTVKMTVNAEAANQVDFVFELPKIPTADVLGYEVVRCMTAGGQVERTPVGFATGSTFTDTITTINNRTVFYEITLVDQYLHRSAAAVTDTVKIEHKGNLDKTDWEIEVEGLSAAGNVEDASDDLPCEPTVEDPALQAIDGNTATVYAPSAAGSQAAVTLNFKKDLVVSGFLYTSGNGSALADCEIQVLEDDVWVPVYEGVLQDGQAVYFANADEAYVSTHRAAALKLILKNPGSAALSFAELDVLGATGDNVDFRRTEESQAAIGILSEDYVYGEGAEDVIPAGSLVFAGSYKGNPAYNVVLLFDQDGKLVGGLDGNGDLASHQIILADVPPAGDISNVSDGTWVYWIAPEERDGMTMPGRVRAELYRVNNALTNEGERLVSDSLFETVPETLPNITLSGGGN